MAAEATRMIKIFYSYSSADAPLQNELERHLEVLKRSGQITTWHDREIQPGVEWKREIDTYLNAADIILLLISPDFLASDYCYSVEMRRALERHKAGEAYVIPIILRPVDWEETPIALLQALPTNGQPITIWRNRDKAFLDVVKGIDKLVKILLSRPKPPKTEERHVEVSSSEGKLKTKEFSGAINIFCRYAREDAPLRDELGKHLSALKRLGYIAEWYDRDVQLKIDWEHDVNTHLNAADIILLLVSPDFLVSGYCDGMEIRRALERHKAGEAEVILINLHSTDWGDTSINGLQALPTDGKPISNWSDQDEAFWNVARGISEIIKTLLSRPKKNRMLLASMGRQEDFKAIQMEHDTISLGENSNTASGLQNKIAAGSFDVFLCHNGKNNSEVHKIGEELKDHGILPWLDEWELQPGLPWQRLLEKQIGQIKSAAVFVGKDGVGPWQQIEIEAFLREFVRRKCPVIPVLLTDAPKKPKLPLFLTGMTWVDFRKQDSDAIEQLIWGITGKRGHKSVLSMNALQQKPGKTIKEEKSKSASEETKMLQQQLDIVQDHVPAKDTKKIEQPSQSQGVNLCTYTNHTDFVNAIAWSPDSTRIASGSSDNSVQVWNATSGNELSSYWGHRIVYTIAWSPNGSRIFSGGQEGDIQEWEPDGGGKIFTYQGHSNAVFALAFSPDGTRIASGSWDRTVRVWDVATKRCILTYHGHSGWVNALSWSPDSTCIASGSSDNSVQVWNATNGQNILTNYGHVQPIEDLAWSPDGILIASGGLDKKVKIWDATTGKPYSMYNGHSMNVYGIAWSPDGTRIASGSWDKTIQIWNIATGIHIFTYSGHTSFVKAVSWSPDGTRIASASEDRTVQVWKAV